MHVDEDLAECAIFVLAGAQEQFVAADDGFLRVALAAIRQTTALREVAHDDAFGDLHRHRGGSDRLGLRCGRVDGFVRVANVVFEAGEQVSGGDRRQRLGELAAVAIQRVGFEAEAPGQHVRRLHVFHRRVVRHVDGLADGTGDERLAGRHHADMGFVSDETLALAAAAVGAIEHREVLVLQVRCALDGHRAGGVAVGRFDLSFGEAKRLEQVEHRVRKLFR